MRHVDGPVGAGGEHQAGGWIELIRVCALPYRDGRNCFPVFIIDDGRYEVSAATGKEALARDINRQSMRLDTWRDRPLIQQLQRFGVELYDFVRFDEEDVDAPLAIALPGFERPTEGVAQPNLPVRLGVKCRCITATGIKCEDAL